MAAWCIWLCNLSEIKKNLILNQAAKLTLKFTWNVYEINLHLRCNWDLNLIEVCATQSRTFHRKLYGVFEGT